ncbi:hypothetical protein LTR09_008183 [Extremus antarcticus]|uniref:Uncharacterized protein n=1 Tax=Extremus antarcticus TaxID=702011 RepID=A0AAJ0G6D4_9PEZI|nr:hypothetical protein LTR09_008183 [Extremus antarcticus]
MDRENGSSSSKPLLKAEDYDEHLRWSERSHGHRSPWARYGPFLLVCAVLLAVSNAFLLSKSLSSWRDEKSLTGPDPAYFGSPDTLPVPFSHDWEGLLDQERDGYRYADEEWSQLFPAGGGSVALTSDFIQQHGIAANAAPTPEDPDKRIYLIAGYHQLHCLSVVRDSIYFLNGTLTEWPDSNGFIWDHVLHCLEAVRIGLTCFLDPTLITLNETWYVIDEQKHTFPETFTYLLLSRL